MKRQYPGSASTGDRMEEKFAVAFGLVDCSSYIHSELCYYLLELVHEELKSRRRLSDLQQLLETMTTAIEELLEE